MSSSQLQQNGQSHTDKSKSQCSPNNQNLFTFPWHDSFFPIPCFFPCSCFRPSEGHDHGYQHDYRHGPVRKGFLVSFSSSITPWVFVTFPSISLPRRHRGNRISWGLCWRKGTSWYQIWGVNKQKIRPWQMFCKGNVDHWRRFRCRRKKGTWFQQEFPESLFHLRKKTQRRWILDRILFWSSILIGQ